MPFRGNRYTRRLRALGMAENFKTVGAMRGVIVSVALLRESLLQCAYYEGLRGTVLAGVFHGDCFQDALCEFLSVLLRFLWRYFLRKPFGRQTVSGKFPGVGKRVVGIFFKRIQRTRDRCF